jgi:sialate O-acetylesterase
MRKYISFLWLFLISLQLYAEPSLPAIFTDNMVLQQKSTVPIWGWATSNKTVIIKTSWDGKAYEAKANKEGKWLIKINTPSAGGPYEITVSEEKDLVLNNVLIGEVWLCSGQSNMEMPLRGYKSQPILNSNNAILNSKNSNIRIYTVPRSTQLLPQKDSKTSFWKEASPSTVSSFSATAYFFGNLLQELLEVPIGLIHTSYGGSNVEAWMDYELLQSFGEIEIPENEEGLKNKNRVPTMLFNGMIHPIVGYGIKGVIWYQGESNYENPDLYEKLFPAMVSRWRDLWKQGEFPFYYVQIAPYNYAQLPPYLVGGKYNSAFLRDAQRKSLSKIPNSAMAVTMDLGEEDCIHPANKEDVGKRLALLALSETYGIEGIHSKSPEYEAMEVNGSTVTIQFKHSQNGLSTFGKEMNHFKVAGKDKVFHPAAAIISGSTVSLSSPRVKEPIAVRYAFDDFVIGDLFGTNGLPVSSFRTDDW